jgi:hypothetical protein
MQHLCRHVYVDREVDDLKLFYGAPADKCRSVGGVTTLATSQHEISED